MNIWLVEISDFLPTLDSNNRLYRTGMLAEALVESGHKVLWWSSTFNHQLRRQRFNTSTTIDIQKNYRLRLLYGPGYGRSVSLNRWKHNWVVAREFAREIKETRIDARPDIIYACLPTLEVSEQAVLYGVRHGIPVVIDILDQWPEIYLSFLPRFFRPIFRNTMLKTEFSRAHRILSQATAITGVSATNLEWGLRLAERNAHPRDKWFPLASPVNSNDKGDMPGNNTKAIINKLNIGTAPFVITFVGSFSTAFNIRTVIDVARGFLLAGERRIIFILIGEGVQLPILHKLSSGLTNIILTGWLYKSSIDEILNISSIGLAPYSSGRLITLPNKPFEYMAAGLPVLSSLEGELKTIIEQESIGIHYKAGHCDDLKDKIMWFLSHPEETKIMGQRAKTLFEKKYRADVVYAGFVEYLCAIASEGVSNK